MRTAMTQPLSAPALRTSAEGASSNATVGALHRSVWTIVAIVMSVVWFALLDVRKLQHPDEGRYAEIAREMLVSGDWVTPRLNGLKYFEKPPLQYWLTAASYKAFELDEWTARLPVTIAGWLAIFVVGYAGLRIASPTAGAYAAVVLAGMVWHFGIAHIITLDAMLSCWLTVALCAFLVAQRAAAAAGERRAFMLVAWAAIAGAVLTKGLIGIVIPAGTIVVYTLLTRDIALWRRLEIMWGVALLLAVCAPWFILVSMRNPEFAQFFFVHEHFQRFLTTEHRRTGGWWYFIPLLVVGLLPWVGMFVWTTIRGWRDAGRDANGFSWARFCLVWVAFVFVFFSASGSKLPSYILPIFPALALVIGWQLTRLSDATLAWLTLPLVVADGVAMLSVFFAYPWIVGHFADARQPLEPLLAYGPWIKAALAIAFVGGVAGLWSLARGRRPAAVLVVAFTTLAAAQLVLTGHDVFAESRSTAPILSRIVAQHGPLRTDVPFYTIRTYDQTLPYYLGRTVVPVDYRDELTMGLASEPDKAIATVGEWRRRWEAADQAYAIMQPDEYEKLKREGVPMLELARDARHVVIGRR